MRHLRPADATCDVRRGCEAVSDATCVAALACWSGRRGAWSRSCYGIVVTVTGVAAGQGDEAPGAAQRREGSRSLAVRGPTEPPFFLLSSLRSSPGTRLVSEVNEEGPQVGLDAQQPAHTHTHTHTHAHTHTHTDADTTFHMLELKADPVTHDTRADGDGDGDSDANDGPQAQAAHTGHGACRPQRRHALRHPSLRLSFRTRLCLAGYTPDACAHVPRTGVAHDCSHPAPRPASR